MNLSGVDERVNVDEIHMRSVELSRAIGRTRSKQQQRYIQDD